MNIKGMLTAITLLAAAAGLAQESVTNGVTGSHRRKRRGAPRGEMVLAPAAGPRVFVVNEQTRVEKGVLDAMRETWHRNVWLHSEMAPGDRRATLADEACGLAICVVDRPVGETLLVSPEGRWVELNVASLAADAPSKERLEARVKKEMWRALAYGMGVGNEQLPSLLTAVGSVKELDAVEYTEPTPMAFNQIIYWAAKRKMARVRYTTYRQACREGWAPTPTNDAQRAMWQEVKSDKERGPAKPLTIPPPAKK